MPDYGKGGVVYTCLLSSRNDKGVGGLRDLCSLRARVAHVTVTHRTTPGRDKYREPDVPDANLRKNGLLLVIIGEHMDEVQGREKEWSYYTTRL